jgi:hypothetical protein
LDFTCPQRKKSHGVKSAKEINVIIFAGYPEHRFYRHIAQKRERYRQREREKERERERRKREIERKI